MPAPACAAGRATGASRPFGSRDVQEFLSGLDVFLHFPDPAYIEEFGGAAMEAMAAGVPVILAPELAEIYGEAALTAAPDAVWPLVERLWRDRGVLGGAGGRGPRLRRGQLRLRGLSGPDRTAFHGRGLTPWTRRRRSRSSCRSTATGRSCRISLAALGRQTLGRGPLRDPARGQRSRRRNRAAPPARQRPRPGLRGTRLLRRAQRRRRVRPRRADRLHRRRLPPRPGLAGGAARGGPDAARRPAGRPGPHDRRPSARTPSPPTIWCAASPRPPMCAGVTPRPPIWRSPRRSSARSAASTPRRFSGGDAAFCRRAGAAGHAITLVPDAVVSHPCRTGWDGIATKARRTKGGQIRGRPPAPARRLDAAHALPAAARHARLSARALPRPRTRHGDRRAVRDLGRGARRDGPASGRRRAGAAVSATPSSPRPPLIGEAP